MESDRIYDLRCELWETIRSFDIEQDCRAPYKLQEALVPGSKTRKLVEYAWTVIPTWNSSFDVISGLLACDRIARKIPLVLPESLSIAYTFTFSDNVSIKYTKAQLLPLLSDSEPMRSLLLNDQFKENNKKEVNVTTISSIMFTFILKYFYQPDRQHETYRNLFLCTFFEDSPFFENNLLDLLETGYFLLNKHIVTCCLYFIQVYLTKPEWYRAIDLNRLIALTLNHPSLVLVKKDRSTQLAVQSHLSKRMDSAFEKLKNARWNVCLDFLLSTFEPSLNEISTLMSAIQKIDDPTIKQELTDLALKKIKGMHHTKKLFLLGSVEDTTKILSGLLKIGFSRKIVFELIKEFSGDLETYFPHDELRHKQWKAEAQKIIDSYQLEFAR